MTNQVIGIIPRLDEVLKYIANSRGNAGTDADIKNGLARLGIEMAGDELLSHLNQLVKDGAIRVDNRKDGIGIYSILSLGRKAIIDGGYQYAFDEKQRIRKVEKLTFFLNCMIALGTGVAACYYLLEILRVQYHLGLPKHVPFP